MRVLAQQIHQQLVSVFHAWGMSDAHAATTAEMMVETDLRGVDWVVDGNGQSVTDAEEAFRYVFERPETTSIR